MSLQEPAIKKCKGDTMKGYIHSTESFASVDGPGVRFLIFTSGCRFRCQYCHNPDTWKLHSGEEYDAETLLNLAEKYRPYWGKEGGITVSGGEPLLQIDFLIEFFRLAKKRKIHTVLDTSGGPFHRTASFLNKINQLMEFVDLVLLDIKQIEEKKHRELTGSSNKNVLDFAKYLSEIGKPVWIRHVLVPGKTDEEEDLQDLKAFLNELENVERVEVLPYHTLGEYKWKELQIPYPLAGVEPPSQDKINRAREILEKKL